MQCFRQVRVIRTKIIMVLQTIMEKMKRGKLLTDNGANKLFSYSLAAGFDTCSPLMRT